MKILLLVAGASALDKPLLIYFGGYRASTRDMTSWEAGCRAQYGATLDFEGNSYRGADSSERSALAGAAPRIAYYQNLIRQNPDGEFILVGHSSGASIPAAIAQGLPTSAKLKIVVLDGFASGARFQDRIPTVCYSNMNSVSGCRNNTRSPSGDCRTKMCGHFRMVNANAPANATIATGYANFRCNLEWLDNF